VKDARRRTGRAPGSDAVVPRSGVLSLPPADPGLRQFAEYQPFTPVTDTVRALLTGGTIGDHAIVAIAWSLGIAVVSYLWAIRLYNRRRAATPS
jgi:ABC-2 type transport system permease protein